MVGGGNVRTPVIKSPLVTASGAGDMFCAFLSFRTLFQSRQAHAPEHTPAFLGCPPWFFTSYFVHPPTWLPHLSPVLFLHQHLLSLPPHPPFSPLHLCDGGGRVQQEVHLHLYHTCNVLSALIAGLNSMASTWHLGNRMPVISRPHPKAHFTWRMSGNEQISLMQPVQPTLISSPLHKTLQTFQLFPSVYEAPVTVQSHQLNLIGAQCNEAISLTCESLFHVLSPSSHDFNYFPLFNKTET